eukprot:UN08957
MMCADSALNENLVFFRRKCNVQRYEMYHQAFTFLQET